jgi:hypothetical protein
MRDIDHIVSKIIQLQYDKGLVESMPEPDQLLRLINEVEQLDEHVYGFGNDINMEEVAGSIIVRLIWILEKNGSSLETCLNKAYEIAKG